MLKISTVWFSLRGLIKSILLGYLDAYMDYFVKRKKYISMNKYTWQTIKALFPHHTSIVCSYIFQSRIHFHESEFTNSHHSFRGISLHSSCHFHSLHRYLEIQLGWVIAAESYCTSVQSWQRTRTGNLWFPNASR